MNADSGTPVVGGIAARAVRTLGWRVFTLIPGVAAQIWTARTVAAAELGMATLAFASVGTAAAVTGFVPDLAATRTLKSSRTPEQSLGSVLAGRLVTSLLGIAVVLGMSLLYCRKPEDYLSFVLATVLVVMLAAGPNWVLVSEERQDALHRSNFVGSIAAAILTLTLVRSSTRAPTLVAIYSVGAAVGFVTGWIAVRRMLTRASFPRAATPIMKVFRGSSRLYLVNLLNFVAVASEIPIMGLLLSPQIVAQYRVAGTVRDVVHSFLSISMQFFYPRLIAWHAQGITVLWRRQLRLVISLAVPVVACIVIIAALSPTILRVGFGHQYSGAAYALTLLVAAKFVSMVAMVFTGGLIAARKDNVVLVLNLCVTVIGVFALFSVMPAFGITGAAAVNCLNQVLFMSAGGAAMFLVVRWSRRTSSDAAAASETHG